LKSMFSWTPLCGRSSSASPSVALGLWLHHLRAIFGEECQDFLHRSGLSGRAGFGAGVVRSVTGIPTPKKSSSCPAGEEMHSNRAGCWVALVKKCGALAGMLTLSPARMTDFLPRKVASISPARMVNDSSKAWRWGGGPPRVFQALAQVVQHSRGDVDSEFTDRI